MATLKINCHCTEEQMQGFLRKITDNLNNDTLSIDEVIGDIRLSVEVYRYFDDIKIKEAEILDELWDVLPSDTAVLNSRLKTMLENYNSGVSESISQAKQIRKEQLSYMHC